MSRQLTLRLSCAQAVITALALLATTAGCAELAARAAAGAGPTCVGLVVTGCQVSAAGTMQPARTSPLLFLLVLVVGACAVTWLSNRTGHDDAAAPDERTLDDHK